MSSGMSSDQFIKYEIKENVNDYQSKGIVCRIFPSSSNQDQRLVADGGLTFSADGVNYGSCDVGWFYEKNENGKKVYEPLIGLEATDALNRGSSGNAQYQRFHHALGAVRNGDIGIYYLKEGISPIQPDLYEMAYNATVREEGSGAYIITQDLKIVDKILNLISIYGKNSDEVKNYVNNYILEKHELWKKVKFSKYNYDWNKLAQKRSTILGDDFIIKYTGRMKRNFTDGSQRAGHIAVGEMYLSKYLFYGKKVYYLCPRMSKKDVDELDRTKKDDKEWSLLRHEENVFLKTRDDIIGLRTEIIDKLVSIQEKPLKNGTDAMKIYKECLNDIVLNLKSGIYKLKK